VSSIPAVKSALVAILSSALPNTQVIYGPGTTVTTLRSRILVVGESVTGTLTSTSIDLSSGTEQYSINMLASVSISGTNGPLADTEALADFAATVAAIQDDPHLGGNTLTATVDGSFELSETANDSGRSADVRFPVNVFATI
jgi:hypothetical protein